MLALLYDVHGNLPALEAVLADARADRHLLGGDYALMGGWPRETLERLRALPDATWIRGNADRWLVERPDDGPPPEAFDFALAQLGEAAVRELYALPGEVVLDGTRFVHASPKSDMDGFSPVADERDAALLEGVAERRVVFGHTHVQFRREAHGIELVNPGSVGMPFDGDRRAAYALLDGDRVELRRVEYDVEAAVRRCREAGLELAARRLERASFG